MFIDTRIMVKKYFIKTFGCQMNVYDSNRMANMLEEMGLKKATGVKDADVVIFNTCHIREKAAEKVFSDLGLTSSSVQSRSAAWKSLYFEGITLRKTGLGSRALKTLQLHPMCAFSQYKNICSGYESAG